MLPLMERIKPVYYITERRVTPPKNTWTNDTVKWLFRNACTSRSFITTCIFLRPLPTPDKPIWVDEWLLFYESKMYWSEMVRVHLMNNRYKDNSRPVALVSWPGDTLAPAGVLYDVINDVINQMRSSQVRKIVFVSWIHHCIYEWEMDFLWAQVSGLRACMSV